MPSLLQSAVKGASYHWLPSAVAGSIGGGFLANIMSNREDRGMGTFLKGATAGFGAGAAMHGLLGTKALSSATRSLWRNSMGDGVHEAMKQGPRVSKAAYQEIRNTWAKGVHRVAVGLESRNSRAAVWGATGLLAGGMVGSGRSRASGINGTRGNRFGG